MLTTALSLGAAVSKVNSNVLRTKGALALINISARKQTDGNLV
jgi:hypothetical protein